MTMGNTATIPMASAPSVRQDFSGWRLTRPLVGALLGPIAGLLIWWLPLGVTPTAHLALAIVALMFVYWITEPIEPGLTALLGCFLFWALEVTKSSVAFSGFASNTPWYLFAVLLMSEAASQTGLAQRIGYLVVHTVGTSYSRLLLSHLTLVFLLQFLIPNGAAQLAIMAPVMIGIFAAFNLGPHSNMAKGVFIIVTYACSIFNKMIMSGGSTILARGIIEEQTGIQVLWSQWFLAFLPVTLLTIVACWLIIRWLYPAETPELPWRSAIFPRRIASDGPVELG